VVVVGGAPTLAVGRVDFVVVVEGGEGAFAVGAGNDVVGIAVASRAEESETPMGVVESTRLFGVEGESPSRGPGGERGPAFLLLLVRVDRREDREDCEADEKKNEDFHGKANDSGDEVAMRLQRRLEIVRRLGPRGRIPAARGIPPGRKKVGH